MIGRVCRICGCTDDDCSACIEKTGEPCAWHEEDLCTACVPEAGPRELIALKKLAVASANIFGDLFNYDSLLGVWECNGCTQSARKRRDIVHPDDCYIGCFVRARGDVGLAVVQDADEATGLEVLG